MKLKFGVLIGMLALSALGSAASAQALGPGLEKAEATGRSVFLVEPVVEKTVEKLPDQPLYWRVESFPTLAAAQGAAGPLSLATEAWGKSWLFTLGPAGAASASGARVAEIGPVPIPRASTYLLRINRAGGPPGVSTPVHIHPGSEAFYVVKGQLTQKTAHGKTTLDAGESMNGHEPGMVMQLVSTGTTDLEQLVMFVVDAGKPFSIPASFD